MRIVGGARVTRCGDGCVLHSKCVDPYCAACFVVMGVHVSWDGDYTNALADVEGAALLLSLLGWHWIYNAFEGDTDGGCELDADGFGRAMGFVEFFQGIV